MNQRLEASNGFTLVELLVSLLIFGFLTLLLQSFCTSAFGAIRVLEITSQAQESARIGLTIIARDLRDAGYGLSSESSTGVTYAEWHTVRLARDLNSDGALDDSNERLAYSLDSRGLRLMRQMGNAPPQPMMNELAADGLIFTYYDANGLELSDGPLSLAQRQSIRRIDVELCIETDHPDPSVAEAIRTRRRTTVFLRNGA